MNDLYRGLSVFIPTAIALAAMLWILWNFYRDGRKRWCFNSTCFGSPRSSLSHFRNGADRKHY